MTTKLSSTQNHASQPNRMWSGAIGPDTQTRLFRRRFEVTGSVRCATLRLFAQAKYLLYVDGLFLDRGPCFHHPIVAPFDTHDLTNQLIAGCNVLAVLVQAINVGIHNHVPSGEPGLCVHLHWEDDAGEHVIEADNQWRVSDQTGWRWPNPQRTWAIGPVEVFDMHKAQTGWQATDFDDALWQVPEISPLGQTIPGGVMPMDRLTPMLRYQWIGLHAQNLMDFKMTTQPVAPVSADDPKERLARRLEELTLATPPAAMQFLADEQQKNSTFTITGLTPDCGAVLHFDLDAMYVGQVILDCELPSDGVIDIAWTEALVDGKPCWSRKGASYVDRIIATTGKLNWRPITFSGMRYVTLILRGFSGDIRINRLGVDSTEPQLNWLNDLKTSDPMIDAIFKISQRTIRIGTQEALMDCPTREQAAYVGDGLPVALWIMRLTGDARYFKDLVIEQFRRQSACGLIRSTPFSWRDDTLIDYNLIAIMGTWDYLNLTDDQQTIEAILPAARKLMSWFTDQLNQNNGLLKWQWNRERAGGEHENRFDPTRPKITSINLFIDHAGMGWHNVDDAGIDRRGTNAALHAFLCLALEAMAKIESHMGNASSATQYQSQAADLVKKCSKHFFDCKQNCFIDGVLDGQPLPQVSEQTNTLAVLAGWCDDEQARNLLQRLLTQEDKSVARNGYYFWLYTFAALKQLDMVPLAMTLMRQHWQTIINAQSTTVWETMAGDHLDSHCHPWSCVPASMLLTDILGLGGLESTSPSLTPRYDLLNHASGSMHTPHGLTHITWQTQDDTVQLSGQLPAGITANLIAPDGQHLAQISNQWQLQIPIHQPCA